MNNGTSSLDVQVADGAETQQWDVIPTGESDYYRMKTRSHKVGHLDSLFLQVPSNETVRINLARRDNAYLGQQWRILWESIANTQMNLFLAELNSTE